MFRLLPFLSVQAALRTMDLDFDVHIIGGSKKNREYAEAALEEAPLVGGNNGKLNGKKFAELKRQLQSVPAGTKRPAPPDSTTDGTAQGWLLHQGKMRGMWKKAWYLLKPPYLFQYKSPDDDLQKPKATYYVAYVQSDNITPAEIEQEIQDLGYLEKLEEKACSLRINVHTSNKLKVLTASTEQTMEMWLRALDASVEAHTASTLLECKREAAAQLKTLVAAQLFNEVRGAAASQLACKHAVACSRSHPTQPLTQRVAALTTGGPLPRNAGEPLQIRSSRSGG